MTHLTDEGGFTLIELLVTVVILGIGVTAVIGAVGLGIFSGHVQRDMATAANTMASFAEFVKSEAYQSCDDGPVDYGQGFTPPAEYEASVADVRYWNGAAEPDTDGVATITFEEDCPPGGDAGLQRIELEVTLDGEERNVDPRTTTIIKRDG